MGWKVSVVLLETDHDERYDPELLALVPGETEVIRRRSHDLWQAIRSNRH